MSIPKKTQERINEFEKSYMNGYLYGAINENGAPVCGSYAALVRRRKIS